MQDLWFWNYRNFTCTNYICKLKKNYDNRCEFLYTVTGFIMLYICNFSSLCSMLCHCVTNMYNIYFVFTDMVFNPSTLQNICIEMIVNSMSSMSELGKIYSHILPIRKILITGRTFLKFKNELTPSECDIKWDDSRLLHKIIEFNGWYCKDFIMWLKSGRDVIELFPIKVAHIKTMKYIVINANYNCKLRCCTKCLKTFLNFQPQTSWLSFVNRGPRF